MTKDRDADKFTNDLTIAIGRLNQANEGLIKSFGEAGRGGNTFWNVISRFSSGSTFWRLQNYLRGVSNIVGGFTKRAEENQKAILKNMEANLGLADSLKTLQEQRKNIKGTPLFELFTKDLGDQKLAKKAAEQFYDTQIGQIEKVAKKRGQQYRKRFFGKSIGQRFKDSIGKTKPFQDARFSYLGGMAKFVGEETGISRAVKGTKGFLSGTNKKMAEFARTANFRESITTALFGKAYKKGQFMEGGFRTFDKDGKRVGKSKMATEDGQRVGFIRKQRLHLEKVGKFLKKGKKILPMLGEYLSITTAALGKFLLYGLLIVLGITVLAAIIKKGWPVMRKQFAGAFKFFKAAFMNVIGIVKGVFKLFNAIFKGDVLGALEIFFKDIFLNVVKLIANVLAGLFKVLVGVIGGLLSGLYENTIGRFFSTGGVSMGGPAIVGERGPELVNLPRGARISNNANSMGTRAGGNNIHVHINGRVGASDAEIRDIANKVAREINIRMNRTGANRIGA